MNGAAIIRVGKGRGFFVDGRRGRYVITAMHCLPELPPAHGASYVGERTFGKLLGVLHGRPEIACECLFVDLVADLAVLGAPDAMYFGSEWEAYENFAGDADALQIGTANDGIRRVYSLSGEWVLLADGVVKSGMSGSPIVNDEGKATGAISTGGFNPVLMDDLPSRLVRDFTA